MPRAARAYRWARRAGCHPPGKRRRTGRRGCGGGGSCGREPEPTNLPKWLVGDWNRVIRDPLDLLRLAPLVGAIVSLIIGETTHTVEMFGGFLVVLAPRIFNVQRPFDLVFQLGMNLALWGNVFGLFDSIYAYDKIVHFLLPCGSAMMLYIALTHLRLVPDLSDDAGLHDRIAMVVVTLSFGLMVGGIFEIWEWASNTFLGTEMFVTYGDSIGDLIDDALGALAGGVILLFWTGRGWRTWRAPGAALRGEEPMPPAPSKRDGDALTRIGDRLASWRPPRGHADEPVRPYPTLPRWLAGDWGPVIRDPVDIVRASLLAGALLALLGGDLDHMLRFLVGFGASLLIRWAEAPRPFDGAFALAMAFQGWGAFAGAFDSVDGFEVAARIFSDAAFAAGLYLVLVKVRAVPDLKSQTGLHERTGMLLTATSLGFAVGMLYEIGAWAANGLFDAGPMTFDELIASMSISFFASLLGGFLLVLWDRRRWGTRRVPAELLVKPAI